MSFRLSLNSPGTYVFLLCSHMFLHGEEPMPSFWCFGTTPLYSTPSLVTKKKKDKQPLKNSVSCLYPKKATNSLLIIFINIGVQRELGWGLKATLDWAHSRCRTLLTLRHTTTFNHTVAWFLPEATVLGSTCLRN